MGLQLGQGSEEVVVAGLACATEDARWGQSQATPSEGFKRHCDQEPEKCQELFNGESGNVNGGDLI